MGRVILLRAHVQSGDTEQEGSGGSEGERELVHLQLVPVDCGKDYTQIERERERCSGSVLAHTEYPASNLLHCTVHGLLLSTHSSLFPPSHTHTYTCRHKHTTAM